MIHHLSKLHAGAGQCNNGDLFKSEAMGIMIIMICAIVAYNIGAKRVI